MSRANFIYFRIGKLPAALARSPHTVYYTGQVSGLYAFIFKFADYQTGVSSDPCKCAKDESKDDC